MRKGFTLLELIVVIIIIGILATLGFVQYTAMIEKGRRSEAASVLGAMRSMQLAYNQESGTALVPYATVALLNLGLPAGATSTCTNTSYFFQYEASTADGTGTAHRCASGGKTPNATTYDVTLTIAGVFTGLQ